MKDIRGLSMIQLVQGTKENIDILFPYAKDNPILDIMLQDAEHMVIESEIYIEDSGIVGLPKFYAEHIRIYARLTSKIVRKLNLE